MKKINAAITGIHGWVPDYVLTNDELATMVDTNDEWITTRCGIKERRILKDKDKAAAYMGAQALQGLLEKKKMLATDIDLIICATITPDMQFPSTANIIADMVGATDSFGFDISAACSGYVYAIDMAAKYIQSGQYKKVIVVTAEKMSSITDYNDRTTCILFGDGAAATLLEPTEENLGVMDSILKSDGSGRKYLNLKAGGSLNPASQETIDNKEHYLFQDGKPVFKSAVTRMADVAEEVMKRNDLESDDIAWLVPHQANKRIIDATARRCGVKEEQVMINISRFGNTTAATIPLCLWEWEKQLKKGDNLILAAFGGGFTWGSNYIKWAYDTEE